MYKNLYYRVLIEHSSRVGLRSKNRELYFKTYKDTLNFIEGSKYLNNFITITVLLVDKKSKEIIDYLFSLDSSGNIRLEGEEQVNMM